MGRHPIPTKKITYLLFLCGYVFSRWVPFWNKVIIARGAILELGFDCGKLVAAQTHETSRKTVMFVSVKTAFFQHVQRNYQLPVTSFIFQAASSNEVIVTNHRFYFSECHFLRSCANAPRFTSPQTINNSFGCRHGSWLGR